MDRRSQLDEEDAEAGAAGAEGRSGRSGRQATDIKSNNPHLAGGESVQIGASSSLYIPLYPHSIPVKSQ